MSAVPTHLVDVPPYQIQDLIAGVDDTFALEDYEALSRSAGAQSLHIRCAQASGSEIYVGCANGQLIRYALQADDPNKLESYSILSRQMLPNEKPVDEIVLIPSISRALVLSDRQIHFYTLPSLDPVPQHMIKPIRNVVTFAVDVQHLQRPAPSLSAPSIPGEPVEFSVIKRSHISMYSLQERLFFQKEIPLPNGANLARRIGRSLCIADKTYYNVVDLENASLFPVISLNQAGDDLHIKPHIVVVGLNEFLILSWTGASTLGVFISTEGDAVRGILEWSSHPTAICVDYPYIVTLLPNGTVEVHSIATQAIVQMVAAPSHSEASSGRVTLAASLPGYLVPSSQKSDKMKMHSVGLKRT